MNPSGWEPISIERLMDIYALVMDKYGGLATNARTGCVEGSLGAAKTAALYHDDSGESHPLYVAAFVMYYLALNHCFGDGNKRVAWAAMIDMLRTVGLDVEATVRIRCSARTHNFSGSLASGPK